MERNKIIYGGQTLIDLTGDTVAADKVLEGYTFHDKSGETKTGNVSFVTYYTGTTEPPNELGSDGDIYLKI